MERKKGFHTLKALPCERSEMGVGTNEEGDTYGANYLEITKRWWWKKSVHVRITMPLLDAQLYTTAYAVAAINTVIAMTFLKPSMVYTSFACLLSFWQYCK